MRISRQSFSVAIALVLAAPVLAVGQDYFDLLEPAAAEADRSSSQTRPLPPARRQDDGGVLSTQAIEMIPAPRLIPEAIRSSEPDSPMLPEPSDESSLLSRPIGALTLDTAANPAIAAQGAKIPDKFAIKDLAREQFGSWNAPVQEASLAPARFAPNEFHFAAPAVYTRPLYFEQPNLERYGHHVADHLTQSALSAAHFFATVPVLPYKMGATHPDECNYVLGAYRPGSWNPHQLLKPELSVAGLATQGAAVTGLILLIP